MKRRTAVAVAVLAMVGLLGAVVALRFPSERAYTVAEVQAGLRANPRAWVGHTVLIEGWLLGRGAECRTPHCTYPRWTAVPECDDRCAAWEELGVASASGCVVGRRCPDWHGQPLILAYAASPLPSSSLLYDVLGLLSQVPVVGSLSPAPQLIRQYRVRLLAPTSCHEQLMPGDSSSTVPCTPQGVLK